MPGHNYFANLIWQHADLLRGPCQPPQYQRVPLPMTVLRRFDCVLLPTKAKVLAEHERFKGTLQGEALDARLNRAAGQRFHNESPLDFEKLKGDSDHIGQHLVSYIKGFSKNGRDIFEYFEFETEIKKMREANILYLVVSKFADMDLHPERVPNEQMGLIFENLIRRFNKLANETAGEHFTPRAVIRLMVGILFMNDDALLATPGTVRKLLGPACGTGGMLAEAQSCLREQHPQARLFVHGQDYNKRAFATVEHPLRLTYRMTTENKARFLDAFPLLLDDVQAIDQALGREPQRDWKAVWEHIQDLLRERRSRGKGPQQKRFREVCTENDPEAEPVLPPSPSGRGARGEGTRPADEPDPDLRDFENVPLKEDIEAYFEREVRPHVPEAWMDRSTDNVGYEINFNRHFYKYTPPRPLEEIDADLKKAEEEILRPRREVTE